MEILKRTQFGNPILRQSAALVPSKDIKSKEIQKLIADMRYTMREKKLGVGLAAPQVGVSKAVIVVTISPVKHRPNVEPFDLTLINPEITEYIGRKTPMYEGCLSGGPGKAAIMAKVPRYKKIKVKYHDENGDVQHRELEGLPAHVVQHETDHLHGILFVDKVKDTKSYVTYAEYMKLVRKTTKSKHK